MECLSGHEWLQLIICLIYESKPILLLILTIVFSVWIFYAYSKFMQFYSKHKFVDSPQKITTLLTKTVEESILHILNQTRTIETNINKIIDVKIPLLESEILKLKTELEKIDKASPSNMKPPESNQPK